LNGKKGTAVNSNSTNKYLSHQSSQQTTMKLPFFSKSHSLSVLLVVLLCLVVESFAAVLAIDYGTEWTKAALVKPGIPLQIVLTKDTKRKEQSVVAFKKQERLYGGDAFNLVSPFRGVADDRERDFRKRRILR
jgi:hypothetical protein